MYKALYFCFAEVLKKVLNGTFDIGDNYMEVRI